MRNYSTDFKSNSFSDIRKKTTPHNQFTGTYGSAFSNPEVMQMRLPSLDSLKSKKPTPFVTERNTKYKLQSLEEKLKELSIEMHNTRMDAKVPK